MFTRNLVLMVFLIISLTSTAFSQWIQTNGPNAHDVQCFYIRDSLLVVGTFENFQGGSGGGVFFTTDYGTSWIKHNYGLTFHDILAFTHYGTNLFAGVYNGGVFACADGDTSWTAVNTGLNSYAIESLANLGTYLFAGGWYGAIFRSSNSGANWIPIYSVPGNPDVRCFAVSGNNLFAGTSGGVYLTTNNGADWEQRSSGLSGDVRSLVVSGTNLFAGTWGPGIYFSSDNGLNWTQVNSGLTHTNVTSFAVSGTNVIAGTYGGGVYFTTNNGANWTTINSGLFNTDVRSLTVTDSTIYAGTYETGSFAGEVWERPLSEILVGVEDQIRGIPSNFILEQNYPNPFNPSTTIQFQLPNSSFVNLKVYDMLGNEVATLVNEYKTAGKYNVVFDASKYSSGVYLYCIQTDKYSFTRKMTLIK
jgi:photosystem II stability/assembly factor-like uncharacterized protein